jgi:hypothetical protein
MPFPLIFAFSRADKFFALIGGVIMRKLNYGVLGAIALIFVVATTVGKQAIAVSLYGILGFNSFICEDKLPKYKKIDFWAIAFNHHHRIGKKRGVTFDFRRINYV